MKLKTLALLLSVVLVFAVLSACSAGINADRISEGKTEDYYSDISDADDYEGVQQDENGIAPEYKPTDNQVPEGSNEYERKIIKTVIIKSETKEFDAATGDISHQISKHDGYVEQSQVSDRSYSQGSYFTRYASYKIRIPADNLDAFLSDIGGHLNIVDNKSTIDDVSAAYYDILTRLETLVSEKDALTKMYENADTVEYMLQVQRRLYDVIEEIEAQTTKLNFYKNQVAYSTVHLSVDEVVDFTEKIPEPETFGERIMQAFTDSWRNFADGCKDFAVWFVTVIPSLLVLAVIVSAGLIILFSVRRSNKRKRHEQDK